MQNLLKKLNEEILPEAFQMLENGNSIGEVRSVLEHDIDPKLRNIFINRLNFYFKQVFRTKYDLLKIIYVLCFNLLFGLMIYLRVLVFKKILKFLVLFISF